MNDQTRALKDKTWQRILPALLAGSFVVLLLAAAYFFARRSGTPSHSSASGEMGGKSEKTLVLYFAANETGKYDRRPSTVKMSEVATNRIRDLVENLFKQGPKGEESLWPFSLRVRTVYLLKNGLLVLDLEEGVQYNQASSVETELRVLRSLVRTVTANFPEIKSVKFLINGSESETLAGHLDITRPLTDADLNL